MITDEQVEAALHYLLTHGAKAAQAKANRVYMDEFRKTIKAEIMKRHLDMPLAAQEREAYASGEYVSHLEALREAVYQDEFHRWGMVAAQARLDAWRTQQANKRGEKI